MSIEDKCDKIRTNGRDKNEVGYLAITRNTVEMNTRMDNGGILHTIVHLCPDYLFEASKSATKEIQEKEAERRKNSLCYRAFKFFGLYR